MSLRGRSVPNRELQAREFLPQTHQHLRMRRLFLPFFTDSGVFRWSDALLDGAELYGSVSWAEHSERFTQNGGVLPAKLVPAYGRVSGGTLLAFRDLCADLTLVSVRWLGYEGGIPVLLRSAQDVSDNNEQQDPKNLGPEYRKLGPEYRKEVFVPGALRDGDRLPNFGWDDHGRLAWGAPLYPNSLVVAAEPDIYKKICGDKRLDTAYLVPERDVFPVET